MVKAVKNKTRGVWLTIWLILMLIGNFFSAITYSLFSEILSVGYPDVASWVWYLYALIALASLVFIIFLFNWKKWPFYALCGVSVIAFFMNLAIGLGVFLSAVGLLGIVILYLSMKSRWKLFE